VCDGLGVVSTEDRPQCLPQWHGGKDGFVLGQKLDVTNRICSRVGVAVMTSSIARSVTLSRPNTRTLAVRNRYVLFGSFLVGVLALSFFALRWKTPAGWAAVALGLVCLWLFVLELRGLVLKEGLVSFPHRPVRWFPIFSFGQRSLSLRQLEEMTVLPTWWGLQVVLLEGPFGAERVLFHSRSARMKFFDAVKAETPDVRIYRSH
jgi:hypothetical protein